MSYLELADKHGNITEPVGAGRVSWVLTEVLYDVVELIRRAHVKTEQRLDLV